MDKVAKQLCLDFMACCTLPFYDLEPTEDRVLDTSTCTQGCSLSSSVVGYIGDLGVLLGLP